MALTLKQEAFCCAYIENGGNASEAYRTTYNVKKATDKTVNEEASKLLASPKVATRVKELRDAIVKRHELTVDDIIAELEEARDIAKGLALPNTGTLVAASMGKAKILGFVKDKSEVNLNVTLFNSDQAKRMASLLNG